MHWSGSVISSQWFKLKRLYKHFTIAEQAEFQMNEHWMKWWGFSVIQTIELLPYSNALRQKHDLRLTTMMHNNCYWSLECCLWKSQCINLVDDLVIDKIFLFSLAFGGKIFNSRHVPLNVLSRPLLLSTTTFCNWFSFVKQTNDSYIAINNNLIISQTFHFHLFFYFKNVVCEQLKYFNLIIKSEYYIVFVYCT